MCHYVDPSLVYQMICFTWVCLILFDGCFGWQMEYWSLVYLIMHWASLDLRQVKVVLPFIILLYLL